MKKSQLLAIAASIVLCLSACSQGGVAIDPAQVKAQVDSTVQAQGKAIQDSVSLACTARMSQVSAKADSMAAAAKAAQAPAPAAKK